MPLQNFLARRLPAISAAWLNTVDTLKFTIFADSATKAQARTALTSDAPLELVNGGTGSRGSADVAPWLVFLASMFPSIWQFIYPRSAAEIAGSAVVVDYSKFYGNITRYGAVAGAGNVAVTTTAWIAAVAQYAQGGSPVYIPGIQGTAWYVSTGTTINGNIELSGDNFQTSTLATLNDITILNVNGGTGSRISNVGFQGKGSGATVAAIQLTDSPYSQFTRVYITLFGIGLRLVGSVGGNYSCSIYDCRMIGNLLIGLQAERNANDLTIINGAYASTAVGIQKVDAQRMLICGCDVENCTAVGIDIDATVGDARGQCGDVIQAVDFESNHTTAGNIRIGNTALVRGLVIVGGTFSPGTSDSWAINPVNSRDLMVFGSQILAGYTSDVWIRLAGSNNDGFIAFGVKSAAGVFGVVGGELVFNGNNTLAAGNEGSLTLAQVTVPYSASMTINAAKGNEYGITVANASAFTINAPTNPKAGKRITIWIVNASGGVMGVITWNAVFKMSAWTNPANSFNRSIDFVYNGTNWYQTSQTGVDIPN